MIAKRFFIIFIYVLALNIYLVSLRFVTHKKDKDQATIDKEVLFEDDDFEDDDVLDLPPEEQKERLKKLVEKKIDSNQDGYVDLKELQEWSLKAFDNFETDDVKEEFTLSDTNEDGFITWQEFEVDNHGEDFSLNTADSRTLEQYQKDKKLFAVADTDKDERLNQAEYVLFRIPRRHDAGREIIIEGALQKYDENNDGAIGLEEYLKENNHNADDGDFTQSDTDHFNEELDENEDGLLTDAEIVQWIDPDNREDAHDEADHLITECDENKDNKLSSDEIVDNHDLWIESDATDYGKHLLMNHDEF